MRRRDVLEGSSVDTSLSRSAISALRMLLAPGFVVVLGLALTVASTIAAYRYVTTAEMARFERLVASAQSALNSRLDSDVDAVHAAAGLFAARGELTQKGFERFVRHLSPAWRLRTRSAGWAEKRHRAEPVTGVGLGATDALVVRYEHPSRGRGLDRVGADLSQVPVVFAAMEKAAAIGEMTSSEYVKLDPERGEAGFFTFFPVYRSGATLETVHDRYAALRGFVFTTRDVDSLIRGINVPKTIEASILARSPPVRGDERARPLTNHFFGPYAFDVVRSVRIGDREWPVRFRTTAEFSRGAQPWLIFVTGLITIVITALFSAVTWLESRARAEAESTNLRLADSEEALKRASRAKDEFLGVVSHELRNPLGAMAGALKVLRLHRNLDEPAARRALEIADRQVRQQSRLVDDLLDVTRLATSNILLDIKPIDLNELLARTVADTRAAAADRGHELSFARAEGPVVVEGDAMRLSQIVSNLILNSIKYTPDGGHISVEVERGDGRAVITVRDDGAGIPPELLDEVFSPFFQQRMGESASKGLGPGLTIAQRLVSLHGGAIAARSDGSGQGSVFTVTLPISTRETVVSPEDRLPSASRSDRPGEHPVLRAVVIDDMADGREILRMLLESLGVEIEDAGTGQTGLDLIEQTRPDVALIDIDLPDMPGFEVARRARSSRGDDIMLVAVTGYGAKEDRAHAAAVGFDEYLVKPVDVNRLAELVDELSTRAAPTHAE